MEKFKGTKKPWHLLDYAGFIRIQDGEFYGDNDLFDVNDVGEQTAHANALLASKSPELLAMLSSLLESLESEVLSTSMNREIAEAHALIKSATELNP